MFAEFFRPVKGITTYQHFEFTAKKCGYLTAKVSCESTEVSTQIFKREVSTCEVMLAPLPRVIHAAGLTRDRKEYLFEQIRPHVRPEFQDVTCPCP